jgi:hypothetical protein
MPPNEDMHVTRIYKERTIMKKAALILVITGFSLAGCVQSALEADYGRSVTLMAENQVYDPTTLTRPSLAAVQGADPNMLDLALTTMRTQIIERKEVSKPIVVNIGGEGGQ